MTTSLLDVLTREGVLLNVSVRYWRAAKKLKAEDLGLNPQDITDRLISLGHKKLLPKDALAAFALIESRAHALVDGCTFPFLNGLGHFLPNKKLEEVTGKLNQLEAEFQTAHADFVRQYATLRTQASREWWEAARKLVPDPDRLVATIESSFPRPEQMDKYFTFAVHLFQIQVPERLETELVTLAEQQAIVQARQRLKEGIQNLANAASDLARADARGIVERVGQMGARRFLLAA